MAMGILCTAAGLPGVFGRILFKKIRGRSFVKLQEKVPFFQGMSLERFHKLQSWSSVIIGAHMILFGAVLLLKR